MEANYRINRLRLRTMPISLFFGLFIMATVAHAQVLGLLPPNITVQPVSKTVQNGDTVTFTTAANCSLGNICTVTWFYKESKNGALPANAVVTTTGLSTTSVSSTLTLPAASQACAGTYYVEIEDQLLGGLLGLTTATATSQNATLSIFPAVTGNAVSSRMTTKGFKIQFFAPTGSNLVIQATSDMKNWTSLCTNVVSGGTVTFTDAVAQTVSTRFYRAKLK